MRATFRFSGEAAKGEGQSFQLGEEEEEGEGGLHEAAPQLLQVKKGAEVEVCAPVSSYTGCFLLVLDWIHVDRVASQE